MARYNLNLKPEPQAEPGLLKLATATPSTSPAARVAAPAAVVDSEASESYSESASALNLTRKVKCKTVENVQQHAIIMMPCCRRRRRRPRPPPALPQPLSNSRVGELNLAVTRDPPRSRVPSLPRPGRPGGLPLLPVITRIM